DYYCATWHSSASKLF
nr:immunoglobulin light chain junction region [Macaca mulatta]MOX29432.1 immunoglobulin light chain junction region [Macaca mulatta]MOX29819.1 immunoglobulin light chain junction region [Macaca mulatta]MOX29907.1 immunoglobulin light chain junction region [Macaca mulatta]MOX30606.1 immunoglobulin light chain junction region [Macaca mulatta]